MCMTGQPLDLQNWNTSHREVRAVSVPQNMESPTTTEAGPLLYVSHPRAEHLGGERLPFILRQEQALPVIEGLLQKAEQSRSQRNPSELHTFGVGFGPTNLVP